MLLRDLVETSGVVAATRSRKAKVAAIAERLAQAEVDELPVVTAYVGGTILQRRTGVGWRGLSDAARPRGRADGLRARGPRDPRPARRDVGVRLAGVAGRRGARPVRPG